MNLRRIFLSFIFWQKYYLVHFISFTKSENLVYSKRFVFCWCIHINTRKYRSTCLCVCLRGRPNSSLKISMTTVQGKLWFIWASIFFYFFIIFIIYNIYYSTKLQAEKILTLQCVARNATVQPNLWEFKATLGL